jgi:hypothetical protein
MTQNNKNGFAVLSVLLITLVLFALVSLAFTANYKLHAQNKTSLRELQMRADSISVMD